MIQFILALIVLFAFALAGAVFGALFPDTFHPHMALTPCAISKQIGPAHEAAGVPFVDDLRWRVVEGDMLFCENRPVSIAGFDAPSALESEAKCSQEAALGQEARNRVNQLLSQTTWSMSDADPAGDLARVQLFIDNTDLRDIMIREGLAKPWDGQGPRPDWCGASG